LQLLLDIAPYLALAAVAVAAILLVLLLVLWSSVRRLRRAQTVILGQHEQRDIVTHVENLDAHVRNMRDAVEVLTDRVETVTQRLDGTITNHAIVRFDAFGDVGGQQSASLALLDNHRNGIIFSSIAARDFARVYVKYLREGAPDRDLSPEELEALTRAVPRPLPSPATARARTAASAKQAPGLDQDAGSADGPGDDGQQPGSAITNPDA
jgi:hypothetical protein